MARHNGHHLGAHPSDAFEDAAFERIYLVKETPQRGSGFVIRLALWFYGLFGYYPFYLLLYPITFVYYLKARNVRHALKLYYKQIGVKFTERRYFTHLRKFAITMTDRFISKLDPKGYRVILDKNGAIEHAKGGALMLFSHFGGWSVVSELLYDTEVRINIIMQEVIKSDIKAVEQSLPHERTNVNTVDLSNVSMIDASVMIAQALIDKEVVAMMGDRANNPKHAIKTEFFGAPAEFNKTPFEIAQRANLPLIVFFIAYKSPRVYEAKFFVLDHKGGIEGMLAQYAKLLEDAVRYAPDQWFNLYDFWESEPPQK
jgi:predicted LPLAT superfamily acyltransferase